MRYKGTNQPLPEIARELGVDGIIEGSVLRAGDRVRITAQLIHASTDEHLWAKSYERDLKDVLFLQSEVARAIAQEIEVRLTDREESLLIRSQQVNPEAHEAYLRGRYFWSKRSPDASRKAIASFERAFDIEPGFALAYAGLADIYSVMGGWGFAPPSETWPHAKDAALKALELDPSLAEAHASLGLVLQYYERDWSGAETEFKRATELNPNYAAAHLWYADFLSSRNRFGEAVAKYQRARELDPLSLTTKMKAAVFTTQSMEERILRVQTILELEPDFLPAIMWLANLHEFAGTHQKSLEYSKRHYSLRGWDDVAQAMEEGYQESGVRGANLREAYALIDRSQQAYVAPTIIAKAFTMAEQPDEAFDWLERAFQAHDPALEILAIKESFPNLRADPRFADLIQRLDFPK